MKISQAFRQAFRTVAGQKAEALKGKVISLQVKCGEKGRLYGSVTAAEVADALKEQYGIELEKNRILLEENIKSFGSYELRCKLGYEVSGTIHLLVVEG